MSQVARAHDVNTNQVFTWRRLYRAARLEVPQKSSALVPIKITDAVEPVRQLRSRKPTRTGIIDIDLGHARIRIEGRADPDCVRAAVEGLIR